MKLKQKFSAYEIALYTLTAILLFVLLISHTYNDILATTRHSINFWSILGQGKLLAFYELNCCPPGNNFYTTFQVCSYNILVYLVFAVWNLPLFLLEHFTGLDVMNNIFCLIYSKMLVVTATGVTVVILKQILKNLHIPENKHRMLLYIYGSSSLLISVIFITAQYDVLSLIFQLLGVWAFLEKKDKQFVFWFGIGFCFKFFALIIFLPLLLLRHKRIWAWIKNGVCVLLPWVITKLPFTIYTMLAIGSTGTSAKGESMAVSMSVSMLFTSNVGQYINILVMAYLFLLVWCYLRKQNERTNAPDTVWACFLAYAMFFGLTNTYPYWPILMAPFFMLIIAISPGRLYINLILEAIGLAVHVLRCMIRINWCYFGHTLKPMVWPMILEGTRFGNNVNFDNSLIFKVITLLNRTDVHAVLATIFLAAVCSLAYISYPGNTLIDMHSWNEESDCRDVLTIRFCLNAVLCLLPILALFI